MSGRSKSELLREKIIGLGERSLRKSYYPELKERIADLERFRALLDQTSDAIFLVDAATGLLVDVNQTACQMLGSSREELLRMNAETLRASSIFGIILKSREMTGQAGQATIEMDLRTPWGGYPAEITIKSVRFRDQEYIVAVARDVTERIRAEHELREAEQKYRSIFENALEGIFRAGMDGRLMSANPAMARIFGYGSAQEMIDAIEDMGRQLYTDPQDQVEVLRLMRRQGYVSGYEALFRRKDGKVIWGSQHVRPVYGRDGELLFTEGIFQDITDRRKAEEENRRLQQQLMQSQKMEAVGTLAGGIAHDFNNLLQVMSGYVQLIQLKAGLGSQEGAYLGEIDEAIDRGRDLVQRLLTFSRRMEVKLSRVHVNGIVACAVRLLERTIPKMVSFELDLDPEAPQIMGDPTQLQQVLVNLINNAVDAMPLGGIIRIETRGIPGELAAENEQYGRTGRIMRLRVSDTGGGMDQQTLSHVFEPFFTTKEPGKGTGLGLSMAYGILKDHNGSISCTSEVGRGSVFTVLIPECDAGEGEQEVLRIDLGRSPGQGETILVVDDEVLIQEIAEDMLTRFGYSVLRASSGEEALSITREGKEVAAVILDLGMPGMGGERCLKALLELRPWLPVIVASGYAMHDLARDPKSNGAAAFLGKPYRMEELLRTIRAALGHETPPHEAKNTGPKDGE
jgi:two-component system, cell cycle sensor histidine kinase and response regulator CckA